jgi:hypothetical protein
VAWRAPSLVLVLACAVFGLAGCGNSPAKHPQAQSTTTTTSIPTPAITTPTIIIKGQSYKVPTEGGSEPIDNFTDSGQQIVLTSKGFLPYHLLVASNVPVTWTNLTPKTVTLNFGHSEIRPEVLKTGASYTYPGTGLLSFIVTSSTGYHGAVTIGAFTP